MQSTVRFIRKNLLTFSFSLLILLIINLMVFTYFNYKAIKVTASIIDPNTLSNQLISQINQSDSSIVINENSFLTLKKIRFGL